MNKSLIMKISYSVIASLIAFAVLLNFSVAPVMAATVESLPVVDVDVVGSYDAENVYVECNGVKYSIPRNTSTGYATSKYYPWTFPLTFETVGIGASTPASYWYSPSMNKIIVVSSSRRILNENTTSPMSNDYTFMIRAYGHNQFQLYAKSATNYQFNSTVAVYVIWDCTTNSVIKTNSFSVDADNLIHSVSINDGAGGSYDDLVCIFSTYEIEGFYESNDNIITPDYYFDYQYLFYTEAKGYVFVDSSEPLKSITNSNNPTKAMLNFSEECNKHVYTSQLGNSWNLSSSVSSMYGASYTMDYSYFFNSAGGVSCYTLVYCNDDSYDEEPLISVEYGTITDIVDKLYQEEIIISRTSWYKDFGSFLLPTEWDTIDWETFLSYLGNKDIPGLLNYVDDLEEGSAIYDMISSMQNETLYSNMTDLYMTYYRFNSDGSYQIIEKTSLYGFVYSIYEVLFNLNTRIDVYFSDLHNDIKSVFDNITVTNTYLYDIKATLKDLPDYNGKFDKVVGLQNNTNTLLSELNSNIINLHNNSSSSGGGSTSTDTTSDLLTGIYFEIDKLSDYFVPDNSTVTLLDDGENLTFSTFQDFIITLDDDILAKLDNMSDSGSSEPDKPDIDIDIDDDIFDITDEDSLADLFGNNFIQSAVSSIATGTLITGTFSNITFSGASAGVTWLNANVTSIYNANTKVASVLILGVTMSVVGLVVRKGV